MNVAAANKIPVQRCLLDGGSCESSAYQLFGYCSVAASIGMGNYHNCAPDGTIQCEYVSEGDYANMVRLCVALVTESGGPDPAKALRDTLERRAASYSTLFRQI
jgi:putative aminopeptidase FrvX